MARYLRVSNWFVQIFLYHCKLRFLQFNYVQVCVPQNSVLSKRPHPTIRVTKNIKNWFICFFLIFCGRFYRKWVMFFDLTVKVMSQIWARHLFWSTLYCNFWNIQAPSHLLWPPPHSFQIWIFYTFTCFVLIEVIKDKFTKINFQYFDGKLRLFHLPWFINSIIICSSPQGLTFEKFIFKIDASSYRFKITCIL